MAGCINQANVKFSNIVSVDFLTGSSPAFVFPERACVRCFLFHSQFRKGSGAYRDLVQDQDQDQIADSHEISVELKSSAEGDEEAGGSFAQRHPKSNRKWSNAVKIAVIVIFFFITGAVL